MSTNEKRTRLVSEAEFRALPPEMVEVAKVVVLDGLAVAVAGTLGS